MKINILGKVKKEVMKLYSFLAWEKQWKSDENKWKRSIEKPNQRKAFDDPKNKSLGVFLL
jgi:hypothetical protein